MKYIKEYKGHNTEDFINKFIDDQIKKTKSFGFEIEPEHIEFEKDVIIGSFQYYKDDISNIKTDSDYNNTRNSIMKYIRKQLLEISEYYFNNTEYPNTRTWYNIHIESIVFGLFHRLT